MSTSWHLAWSPTSYFVAVAHGSNTIGVSAVCSSGLNFISPLIPSFAISLGTIGVSDSMNE